MDWVNDGRMVRRSLKATRYDALILDLGLPQCWSFKRYHPVRAELAEACVCTVTTLRQAQGERLSDVYWGLPGLDSHDVLADLRAAGTDSDRA